MLKRKISFFILNEITNLFFVFNIVILLIENKQCFSMILPFLSMHVVPHFFLFIVFSLQNTLETILRIPTILEIYICNNNFVTNITIETIRFTKEDFKKLNVAMIKKINGQINKTTIIAYNRLESNKDLAISNFKKLLSGKLSVSENDIDEKLNYEISVDLNFYIMYFKDKINLKDNETIKFELNFCDMWMNYDVEYDKYDIIDRSFTAMWFFDWFIRVYAFISISMLVGSVVYKLKSNQLVGEDLEE
ncbi:hypothetical protein NUSPORA_00464 [Nucleospora cyclopteri]